MNLAGIITSFASLAAADAGTAVARKARSLGWYALAGLMMLGALITAGAAGVTWLSTLFPLWIAFGIAAAVFALLGGLVLLVASVADNAKELREKELELARRNSLMSAVGAMGGDANTKALVTAALLGVVSGALFKRT